VEGERVVNLLGLEVVVTAVGDTDVDKELGHDVVVILVDGLGVGNVLAT
jgi:hypothetical protein